VHYIVLSSSSVVEPYIEVHKEFLRSQNPGKNEAWITRQHMEAFGGWLQKECQRDQNIDEQLYLLARQPSWHILTYKGYEINGNTFYTIA
jgi:predicted acetyltransferase